MRRPSATWLRRVEWNKSETFGRREARTLADDKGREGASGVDVGAKEAGRSARTDMPERVAIWAMSVMTAAPSPVVEVADCVSSCATLLPRFQMMAPGFQVELVKAGVPSSQVELPETDAPVSRAELSQTGARGFKLSSSNQARRAPELRSPRQMRPLDHHRCVQMRLTSSAPKLLPESCGLGSAKSGC